MTGFKKKIIDFVKNDRFPSLYLSGIMSLSFFLFASAFVLWDVYLKQGDYLYFEQALQTAYAATATGSVALFGYPVFLRLSSME